MANRMNGTFTAGGDIKQTDKKTVIKISIGTVVVLIVAALIYFGAFNGKSDEKRILGDWQIENSSQTFSFFF